MNNELKDILNPGKTTLLVWDVQNRLVQNIFNPDEFLTNTKNIILLAQEHKVPVIFSKITPLPEKFESPVRKYFLKKMFSSIKQVPNGLDLTIEPTGGDIVAIHGLGGLGHLAVQYSVKLGFKTIVLSRGNEKKELAFKLGAHIYINTEDGDAAKQLVVLGGAKVILCTAPNAKAISELIPGLGRNGKAIVVTGSREPIQVPPMLLLGGERSICGFVGGNMEDTIRFSVLTKVTPMVEVFPMEQVELAYEKMMSAKVHFRSVLKMS